MVQERGVVTCMYIIIVFIVVTNMLCLHVVHKLLNNFYTVHEMYMDVPIILWNSPSFIHVYVCFYHLHVYSLNIQL